MRNSVHKRKFHPILNVGEENQITEEIANETSNEVTNEASEEMANETSNEVTNEASEEIASKTTNETSNEVTRETKYNYKGNINE